MDNVSTNFSGVPCDFGLTARVTLSSVTALVSVFGSCSNVLVLLVPFFHPLMRNPPSFLILNLSVADLAVTAIACPLNLAWLLTKARGTCALGNEVSLRSARRVIITFSSSASLFILSVISLERLSAISWPLKHRTMVTRRRLIGISAAIWTSAIAFGVFAAFKVFDRPVGLAAVVGTVIFYVIITLSYVRIFVLTTRRRTIRGEFTNAAMIGRRRAYVEKQVAKTMAIVIGVFTVCLLPFTVMRRLIVTQENGVLYDALLMLALAHSAANPVIYFYRSKIFRSVLKRVILSRPCCVHIITPDP